MGIAEDHADASRPHWARIVPELVALGACVFLYIRTGALRGADQGPGPAAYPRMLIILLAIAMLVRLAQHIRSIRRSGLASHESRSLEDLSELDLAGISNARVWKAIAVAVGFVVATIYLGWVFGVFILIPVFLYVAGNRKLLITIPLGAVLALGSAYVFVKLVYIALPTGVGVFDTLTVELFIGLGIY